MELFWSEIQKYAKENGIPVNTHHEVTKILKDENGKVYGVEAKHKDVVKTYHVQEKGSHFRHRRIHTQRGAYEEFPKRSCLRRIASPECSGDLVKMASEAAQDWQHAGCFQSPMPA